MRLAGASAILNPGLTGFRVTRILKWLENILFRVCLIRYRLQHIDFIIAVAKLLEIHDTVFRVAAVA